MPDRMIGDILSARRRQLGLSVDRVADDTKLQPRMIDAFERSDFDEMPPKGYAQATLASYARYLGLDPNEILPIYEEQLYRYQRESDFSAHASRSSGYRGDVRDRQRRGSSRVSSASDRGHDPYEDERYDRYERYDHDRPSDRGRSARYDQRASSSRRPYSGTGLYDGPSSHAYGRDRDGYDRGYGQGYAPRDYGYDRPSDRDYDRRPDRRSERRADRTSSARRDERRGEERRYADYPDYPDDRYSQRYADRYADDHRGADRRSDSRGFGPSRSRGGRGHEPQRETQFMAPDDGYEGGSGGRASHRGGSTRSGGHPERQSSHPTSGIMGVLSGFSSFFRENRRVAVIVAAVVALLLIVLIVFIVTSCANRPSQEGDGTIPVNAALDCGSQADVSAQSVPLNESIDLTALPANSTVSFLVNPEATAEPWIEVTVDGQIAYAAQTPAGGTQSFSMAYSATVSVSDPDVVTLSVNGVQVQPVAANGTYTLTASVDPAQQPVPGEEGGEAPVEDGSGAEVDPQAAEPVDSGEAPVDEGYVDEGYTDEGYVDEGYVDEGYVDEGYVE